MKGQKGFTLIELMIVVAIIGALSAIAIPAYKDYVKKSEVAAGIATMKALIAEAELVVQEKEKLAANTDVKTFGIKGDSNPLGTISVPADDTLQFLFNNKSASNSKKITYKREATGWECSQDTGVEIDSCAASKPAPKNP